MKQKNYTYESKKNILFSLYSYMKRLFYLFLLVISFFIYGNNVAFGEEPESDGGTGTTYTYYYGQGCSHCATLDRYLEKTDAYNKLGIDKKEVWRDIQNNTEMLEVCKRLGITENDIGIPLFIVTTGTGEFALIGEDEIINYIQPSLGDVSNDGNKTLVLIILGVLAVVIPVGIIGLTNKNKGGKN